MNTPQDTATAPAATIVAPFTKPPTNAVERFEQCVRKYPGRTLLAATGMGLLAVLAARALTPPPPRNQAVRLLEDIQQRLATLAHSGYDRVSSLAENGAEAVSKGVSGLHMDRRIDKFSRGIMSLFH